MPAVHLRDPDNAGGTTYLFWPKIFPRSPRRTLRVLQVWRMSGHLYSVWCHCDPVNQWINGSTDRWMAIYCILIYIVIMCIKSGFQRSLLFCLIRSECPYLKKFYQVKILKSGQLTTWRTVDKVIISITSVISITFFFFPFYCYTAIYLQSQSWVPTFLAFLLFFVLSLLHNAFKQLQ